MPGIRTAAYVCAALTICATDSAYAQQNQPPAAAQPRPANVGPGSGNSTMTARKLAASRAATRAVALCSGLWSGGRTIEQIDADNNGLGGTESMKTDIDYERKIVHITYADVMPPRIVAFRPVLGCVQLPTGATEDALKYVPQVDASVVRPDLDAKDWPTGDRNATASCRNRSRRRWTSLLRPRLTVQLTAAAPGASSW